MKRRAASTGGILVILVVGIALTFGAVLLSKKSGGDLTPEGYLVGPEGPPGPQGIQGVAGPEGPQGLPGVDGKDGAQGLPGENGEDGLQGAPGEKGSDGAKGDQGIPGVDGVDGAKGDKGDTGPQGPAYVPPTMTQLSLMQAVPYTAAPTTLTATNHAATVARVFPFEVSRPITVNVVIIRTNAVLSNCLILGIYDAAGTRVWTSGVLSTVATNTVRITANLPITLPVGTYYFATTNNNVASTTAAYTVTSAVGAAGFPRWGTVPATAGAMPASINPEAITETTGGWMCYVLLSGVTT